MVREILLLGNPALYEKSAPVKPEDAARLPEWIRDLHDTLLDYRRTYGAGRAIAAPQIGVPKRLIYLCMDRPMAFINPVLRFPKEEKYTLWDDCMSFPGLTVQVERYREAALSYQDEDFHFHTLPLSGDLSELIQHEYDHLDGILATMRALDAKSLRYRK